MKTLARFPGLSLAMAIGCGSIHAATFHVDPAAAPGGDGSAASPFVTLEAARDALRSKPRGGHEVLLHPGIYARKEPLLLTETDSGTPGHPVVWRAIEPRRAQFDGAVAVPLERWEQPRQDERERLDPSARGHVRCADLKALGVRNSRRYPARFSGRGGLFELHAADQRQPLARWPDGFPEKSALMGEVLDRGSMERGVQTPGRFRTEDDRCKRWKIDRGVWLEGYWRVPWDPVFLKVASIEPDSLTITFTEAVPGGIGSKYAKPPALGNRDEPWWAVNVPEEITVPGEWAVDFPSQRLFWWPPDAQALGSALVSDVEGSLVHLQGVSHMRWEGIQIVRGLGHGMELNACFDVELAGVEVRQTGGSGIVVLGGERNVVRSCDLHELGESGILLGGGDRKALLPCQHRAENNHIWQIGMLRKTYAAGIFIGATWNGGGGDGNTVGCEVRHNLVHDTPHVGILYGGNDHRIEFNEIARTVLTSHDMGAIYTQGDWASQGNLVRYNFIHDSPRAIGVYLDDGDSGDTVESNLFVRNINGPSVCGGHHNKVSGNLVYDCNRFGLYIDARGVARGYDLKSRHFQKLQALPFTQPPWSHRYPSLVTLLSKDTRIPHENHISGNVVARCPKMFHHNGKPEELEDNILEENLDLGADDPGFVDAAANDFRLKQNAALFARMPSFKPLLFEKMGLLRDAYRPKPVDAFGKPR